MPVRNYTALYKHKQKIIIPYTSLQVDGKLFLLCITFASIIIGAIFYMFGALIFSNDAGFIAGIASAGLTFMILITAIQKRSAISGNLPLIDKIYKLVFKLNTVVDSNGEVRLLKRGKIRIDKLIGYSKWR